MFELINHCAEQVEKLTVELKSIHTIDDESCNDSYRVEQVRDAYLNILLRLLKLQITH